MFVQEVQFMLQSDLEEFEKNSVESLLMLNIVLALPNGTDAL